MRIEYVSDDEVWVQPSDEHKANVILRVPTNRARLVIGFGFGRNSLSFDASGRDEEVFGGPSLLAQPNCRAPVDGPSPRLSRINLRKDHGWTLVTSQN